MEKIGVCPVCGFVGYAEDAVEVVRCKDCLHRDNSCGMGEHKWCRCLNQTTSPDDYCSYGKRREESEVEDE